MWDEITGSKNPNERSNPNVHRWRNSSRKMRYMHEIDYYPVFKRNRILIHAITQMGLENMLSEISQTKTDKFCMVLLL